MHRMLTRTKLVDLRAVEDDTDSLGTALRHLREAIAILDGDSSLATAAVYADFAAHLLKAAIDTRHAG